LRACSQAGLVNNLNDALTWGLVPLFLAAHGARIGEVGLVAGIYPAVWGVGQIWAGHWSDSVGRKQLIVAGMLIQAAALALLAASDGRIGVAVAAAIGGGVGLLADAIDFGGAIAVVAGLTALSGLWVAVDLPRRRSREGARFGRRLAQIRGS
jgi:MFS family permease